ncbi:unnamed protein product [Paramecium sonneborni]|uniref:Uncharacterized protein n=1 Tax=Paramecium sonneborni TaxID=65129 RepID=A0A8S1RB05_9CILI|nr:unnamed protein product [Paramecium sonneborni]
MEILRNHNLIDYQQLGQQLVIFILVIGLIYNQKNIDNIGLYQEYSQTLEKEILKEKIGFNY